MKKGQSYYFVFIFFFMLLNKNLKAEEEYKENSLCYSSEEIFFSCKLIDKKTASLCGNLGAKDKHLQYRYGERKNVEKTYPKDTRFPEKKFYWIDASGGSVNMSIVKFDIGAYHYNLYDYFIGGISIWRAGKEVFSGICDASSNAFIGKKSCLIYPKWSNAKTISSELAS